MRDVEGRVAFVTGGDSGIGLGIASAFSKAGMDLVITYRTKKHLDDAMTVLSRARGRVHAIDVDVTDRDGMVAAARETMRLFGKVHVLVNNAGIAPDAALSDATFEEWDWCMNVNVNGVFNGIRAFLPHIKSHKEGGHIVATSSIAGLAVFRHSVGIYTTSKFAVVGMMEALRYELAESNIGVSVFCPGPVRSNIADFRRNQPGMPPDARLTPNGEAPSPQERAATPSTDAPNDPDSILLDPSNAGELVLEGVRNNYLYILSHPEFCDSFSDRCDALAASYPRTDGSLSNARVSVGQQIRNPIYRCESQYRRRRLT
jgi:NAD(P)-dependent dehydrogenase (short-subunit alcohol dehydrogenase family)